MKLSCFQHAYTPPTGSSHGLLRPTREETSKFIGSRDANSTLRTCLRFHRKAQAISAAFSIGGIQIAISDPHISLVLVIASAPLDSGGAGGITAVIRLCTARQRCRGAPVPAPLKNVAVHVIEAKVIGNPGTDRMRRTPRSPAVPGHKPGGCRISVWPRRPGCPVRRSPACSILITGRVLPLTLGWQAIAGRIPVDVWCINTACVCIDGGTGPGCS